MLKHFLVLFFDPESSSYLENFSRQLHAEYCHGTDFPDLEHHLTICYFHCHEGFYPEIISTIEQAIPKLLPIEVNLKTVNEYINDLNNFCGLSIIPEKDHQLKSLHKELTIPLEKNYLNYEPLQNWPPHISCFPSIEVKDRPQNWELNEDKIFSAPPPVLKGIQLRLTRWTGTNIETIHRF